MILEPTSCRSRTGARAEATGRGRGGRPSAGRIARSRWNDVITFLLYSKRSAFRGKVALVIATRCWFGRRARVHLQMVVNHDCAGTTPPAAVFGHRHRRGLLGVRAAARRALRQAMTAATSSPHRRPDGQPVAGVSQPTKRCFRWPVQPQAHLPAQDLADGPVFERRSGRDQSIACHEIRHRCVGGATEDHSRSSVSRRVRRCMCARGSRTVLRRALLRRRPEHCCRGPP